MSIALRDQRLWLEASSLQDDPFLAGPISPLFDVDQLLDTRELETELDLAAASRGIADSLEKFRFPIVHEGFQEQQLQSFARGNDSESQESTSFSRRSASRHSIPTSEATVAWPSISTESSFSDFVRSSPKSTADGSPHEDDSPSITRESDDSSQSSRPRSSSRHPTRVQRSAASPSTHERTRIHRKAEKKYRSKLATSLDRLHASVPSLLAGDEGDSPEARRLGITTTRKRNKATTISKAAEFIERLQQEQQMLQSRLMSSECEIAYLRMQNEELRKSVGNVLSTNVTALGTQLLKNLECFKQAAERDVYAILGS